MYREENKFLDLDMVAERVTDSGDREMFREAIKCYQIGSHRAAVILVWMATADCLERRLEELKREGDSFASDAMDNVLAPVKGQASFEEKLITQCRKCDLFDDYEEKCLKFARDTRSKCAHPSGVLPSAEAVRHILEICSQVVLCRTGYRGISFIKDIVTIQFDDIYFIPYQQRAKNNCLEIIEKIPVRLWHLFTFFAAQERPNASTETWRTNALTFFRVLLENCSDDGLAIKIAHGMKGFDAQAPDFFASLVGLDRRVSQFWNKQKRDQARARLVNLSLTQLKAEYVESWATICEQDGFEADDFDLLNKRIAALCRYFPQRFQKSRSIELFKMLAEMAEDDILTNQSAAALKNLLNNSLAESSNEFSKRVIKQIIQRFRDNEKYRELLENVQKWKDPMIIHLLEISDDFLLECSEDNPDDIYYLFEAVSELSQRNHLLLPDEFYKTIKNTLSGLIQPEWRTEGSTAGEIFQSQIELLFARYSSAFADLIDECKDLIAEYIPKNDQNDEASNLDFDTENFVS
ncbi:hypothetical protein ACWATR_36635 [Nostoc sp. UIC 10890]